jgi:hypothetical protein
VEARAFAPVVAPDERLPLQELNAAELRIDGLLEEAEWFDVAGVSMAKSTRSAVATAYYGFNGKTVLLALNGGEVDFQEARQDSSAKLQLVFQYEENQTVKIDLRKKSERGMTWAIRDNIIELKIPFTALSIQNPLQALNALAGQERFHEQGRYLGVALEYEQRGERRRFPENEFSTLSEETTNVVNVIFEVDVVSEAAPRGITVELFLRDGKPLGKFLMQDNGRGDDQKINDKVWTKSIQLKLGDAIEYRYYNGNREELQGERRTARIDSDANTPKQMRLRDAFGRRFR